MSVHLKFEALTQLVYTNSGAYKYIWRNSIGTPIEFSTWYNMKCKEQTAKCQE